MIDQWKKGAKYWDKPWNPVIGCVPVSEGCEHCYAKRTVERFGMNGGSFEPCYKTNKPPRKGIVFAGNMTDLFGEWNSIEQIRSWLGRLGGEAINLVLTKRANRLGRMALAHHEVFEFDHVRYGITAENQSRYDERVGPLYGIDMPAENKWLSLEPLLGPIKLYFDEEKVKPFGWVVVGAESGPDLRECKIEWIESIVAQCQAADIPVFVKQIHLNGKLVTDINQFPAHLQIRQVPWL